MTTSRALTLAVAVVATAAGFASTARSQAASSRRTVITLSPTATAGAVGALRSGGAREIDHQLRMWVVGGKRGKRTLALLRHRGELALEAPVRHYAVSETTTPPVDPLVPTEWWRAAIDAEGLEPPGPGVPVTVVDSGVDLGHPEFVGRPALLALNPQEPAPLGGEHGTMVTSVIGAPINGVGTVGIYPRAAIRSWDTALGNGQALDSVQIAQGILAAARAGRGVINLSLGGSRDGTIELAIDEAVARGSLVVAAAGNDGENGSPLSYPAAEHHVLTVAATDANGQVTSFSSRSPYVDLAAPGEGIMVASAISGGWEEASGTSFSAPIVSGAAAWLWTMRPELDASQVAEILRRSARDILPTGRDTASGFGLLDVGAALSAPTPPSDPLEPNDTIASVTPGTAANVAHAPALTSPTRARATIVGLEDRYEDPTDVYRVWIPARRRLSLTLSSSGDNDLKLSSGGATPRLLAPAARVRGPLEQLTFTNTAAGRYAYAVVTLAAETTGATYRLSARVSSENARALSR